MGVKIYQTSENELKVDKGSASFLTINNIGLFTANNVSSSAQITASKIICDSISTLLNNNTNSVTTNTLVSALINLSERMNMSKGTITNPPFIFNDGSGLYQSSTNGVDIVVGNDTSEPKLSVVSTGILSPNINASTSFYVTTAGSETSLSLKNGITASTGLWVNDTTTQVGVATFGSNKMVVSQGGIGVTGSLNISVYLAIGSSGTASSPAISLLQNNCGFFQEGTNVSLSIEGTKRFDGTSFGARVNGKYDITSGTLVCGYISNGVNNTTNIGIYDKEGNIRVEGTTSGVNISGNLNHTDGSRILTLDENGMNYNGVIRTDFGSSSYSSPICRLSSTHASGFSIVSGGGIHLVSKGNWIFQNGNIVTNLTVGDSYRVGYILINSNNRNSPSSPAFQFQFGTSVGMYSTDMSNIYFTTADESGTTGSNRLNITGTGIVVLGMMTCTGRIVPQAAILPNINFTQSNNLSDSILLSNVITRTDRIVQLTSASNQAFELRCDTNPTSSLKFSILFTGNGTKTNTFSLANSGFTWGSGNHNFVTNFTNGTLSGTSYTWTEPKNEKIDLIYNYDTSTPTNSQWIILRVKT